MSRCANVTPATRAFPMRRVRDVVVLFVCLLVSAISAQAQVCANPGKDGPGGTLSGVINTYYPGTATASAGSTSISIGTATPLGSPAIATGDLLLVIQMQDAAINSTNTDSYGDGDGSSTASGYTALNNAGRYEYVVATGPAGGTVSIRGTGAGNGLLYTYTNAAAGTQGQRRFQVVRVPQYSSATLSSGLTAAPWNGATGGILVFDAAGNLNLGGATVSVNGMGFRGGGTRPLAGGSGGSNNDYRNLATSNYHGGKGEGIAGTPRYVYDGATVINTFVEGYPNGSTARGAPGNAGGGGTDGNTSANDENSGGGGGGNGGAGGQGGRTWDSNMNRGGHGGVSIPVAGNRMVLGGGGGGGSRNNSAGTASSGGPGGGIVMIRASTFSGSGTISANGSDGNGAENDGSGGGGAGGSVLAVANSGGLGALAINARGGDGGDSWPLEAPGGTPGQRHGPGGGGGGGFIAITSGAGTNVSGGANGITTTASDPFSATGGATGSVLSISPSVALGAGSGAQCVPVLTVTKSTSTPSVNNTPTGVTATYAMVVSNAANRGAATNLAISDTLPAGFTFLSTTSVALAGGATRPSTTNPAVGAAIPNWGVFTIPGGGSVTLTFVAQIASTVGAGTYQNPATATYTDPARTVALGTTTSNYNPASSTAEDVTVTIRDLTIAKTHTGNFTQGQVGATYSITASNVGTAATTGTVTVTDVLPAGLTATAISGTGWVCVLGTLTCTRNTVLAAGASYPVITVTVNVATNAAASVTNTANVSGGGQTNTANDSVTDPTTINPMPDLTIAKSHTGNFTQGQTGATYSVTVTNSGFAATSGVVTVTDVLPAGLTATAISGTGWVCVLGTLTCTRNTVLAAGASYPVITLTVNVSLTAPASVTNSASVSGGGESNGSNNTANDLTTINAAAPPSISLVKSVVPAGAQVPGTDLTYTIAYANTGGQPATTFVVVDPNIANIDPQERIFRNLDFKVATMTSSPGTTGLVANFEYSNNGGSTWTYTPASGGGGAPAGYDRNVTNVRWSFTGSLSHLAPNNAGSVSFVVRIR